MSKIKKAILSICIACTMLLALVFGLCLNHNKPLKTNTSSESVNSGETSNKIEQTPEYYTHAANELSVVDGSEYISYFYAPSATSEQTKTVAYKYVFGNTMDTTTGVRLKPIDEEGLGVRISYLYSDTEIETDKEHTSETKTRLQEIAIGKQKYIYIIVSPLDDTIPTTFTSNITWAYGVPEDIAIYHAATGTKIGTHKELTGMPVELDTLIEPATPAGEVVNGVTIPYTFDGWYSDRDCSAPLEEVNDLVDKAIYIRYANLPSDYLQVSGSEAQVKKGTSQLPENLVIPSTFNGKPVTTINREIFTGNTTLKTVYVPDTVTYISTLTFSECTNLTTFRMTKNLTNLRSRVFEGCTKLESIILPDTLNTISNEGHQFYNCPSLESAKLSSNLPLIPSHMFGECSSLKSIEIPNTATEIGDNAFYNCGSLTTVKMGNNIQKLGCKTFSYCRALTSIEFPNTLTTIEDSMGRQFYNCSSLKTVKLSTSVNAIPKEMFYNCVELTNIIMPQTASALGQSAFSHCSKLSGIINIPTGVTYISESAFAAAGMTAINIPDTVTEISSYAFSQCPNLTTVRMSNNLQWLHSNVFRECTSLLSMYFPDTMTTIGSTGSQFNGCTSLKSVRFPNSLQYVPQNIFLGCSALEDVNIPTSATKIEYCAFNGCSSLKEVYIPDSVTEIGGSAFNLCSNLANVRMSNKLYYLHSAVFDNCTSLTSITLPDTLTTLSTSGKQFYNCTSLKTARLSNNITSITDSMFYNCTSLESINIPSSLTNIENNAFNNCKSLTGTLTIPTGVTNIGQYAFYRCSFTKLNDLSNCTKLTAIGTRAFYYCEKMTGTITIPASVTKIGERALRNTLLTVSLADTNGWWVTENSDYTAGIQLTSADLAANANTYLTLATHYAKWWYKQ